MINNKDRLIIPYIINKDVLHIGCLGDFKRYKNDLKVFEFFKYKDFARSIIGMDSNTSYLKDSISMGLNIDYGNAHDFFYPKRKFDIIYSSDLIEHLHNFEGFFMSMKRHIKDKESRIVITTPNPGSLSMLWNILMNKVNKKQQEQHTCMINEKAMREIVFRFGFKIEKILYYTQESQSFNLKNMIYRVGTLLNKRFAECLMFVIKVEKK